MLERLPARDQARVETALGELSRYPFQGKKLQGEYQGYYSIRVWPYRIIYAIMPSLQLVIIVRVGHRQGVY